MAEKTYTVPEIRAKLAETLKGVLAKHEENIANLRAREQKLSKHELCPLCSGPDINGMCACMTNGRHLQKNAVQGYASPNGGQIGSNMGPQSGGTQPMAMAEMCKSHKMGKLGKCESCGKPYHKAMNGEGDGGAVGMKLAEKAYKDEAGLSDVGQLSKKSPPGMEDTVHKLKDEYGHDKEGKEKAFATAWAIKNGTVNHKKSEVEVNMKTTPHLSDAKPGLAKAAMPSSSAAALAPKPAAPATPVSQVNRELGGFKSIAASPTHMPGKGGLSLTPGAGRKPLASMGRASHAVAGEIPNAKAEKNYGSARSPYGTGGPGHASQTNMQSAVKANLAPTAKAEKDPETKTTVGRGLDDKPVPGTKPPVAGKEVSADGSGGDIKAGKALRKDVAIPAKKVGGKQPVGMGGGDAMKPTHPETAAALADVKGLSPQSKWAGQGLPALKTKLAAPTKGAPGGQAVPPGQLPSVDVDVSDLGAPAKTVGQRVAGVAAAPARGNPAALNAAVGRGAPAAAAPPPGRDALDRAVGRGGAPMKQAYDAGAALKEDKRRGGVGFLNALKAKFRPEPAMNTNINPDGTPNRTPIVSQRFAGAKPLQRAEMPAAPAAAPAPKPAPKGISLGKGEEHCALCKGAEHMGPC